MREFVYYSNKAVTAGNFIKDDLMKAGRMDIVCNVVISVLFLSHKMREDVRLHLVFHGPPNPPRHLILESNQDMPISKKDIAGLIKRMLYKCKDGEKREIFPGCFIEKKGFQELIKELEQENKKIIILDSKGEDIRELSDKGLKNAVFVLGDQEGIPRKEQKRFKKTGTEKVSVGPETLFASQTIIILHNELDRRRRGQEGE